MQHDIMHLRALLPDKLTVIYISSPRSSSTPDSTAEVALQQIIMFSSLATDHSVAARLSMSLQDALQAEASSRSQLQLLQDQVHRLEAELAVVKTSLQQHSLAVTINQLQTDLRAERSERGLSRQIIPSPEAIAAFLVDSLASMRVKFDQYDRRSCVDGPSSTLTLMGQLTECTPAQCFLEFVPEPLQRVFTHIHLLSLASGSSQQRVKLHDSASPLFDPRVPVVTTLLLAKMATQTDAAVSPVQRVFTLILRLLPTDQLADFFKYLGISASARTQAGRRTIEQLAEEAMPAIIAHFGSADNVGKEIFGRFIAFTVAFLHKLRGVSTLPSLPALTAGPPEILPAAMFDERWFTVIGSTGPHLGPRERAAFESGSVFFYLQVAHLLYNAGLAKEAAELCGGHKFSQPPPPSILLRLFLRYYGFGGDMPSSELHMGHASATSAADVAQFNQFLKELQEKRREASLKLVAAPRVGRFSASYHRAMERGAQVRSLDIPARLASAIKARTDVGSGWSSANCLRSGASLGHARCWG